MTARLGLQLQQVGMVAVRMVAVTMVVTVMAAVY
jgi:hypothetical protein